jgi:predicted nucleotidyltransferase
MSAWDLLVPKEAEIARQVLAEESARRRHLVIYLSGAHAYGFPSPDSDLDLKAIHMSSTAAMLGLAPPPPTFDRAEIIEGVEIDYTSNEIGHVLSGILGGNGNFIERVLGPTTMQESPWLASLRPLVQRSLSKRVARHYLGFAGSQRKELEERPLAKKILYVLRTTLTGAHLLSTGELVTDVTQLLDRYGFSDAHALVQTKRRGERTELSPAEIERWRADIERAFARVAEAQQASPLPEEPPNMREIDAWLIALRKELLD